MHWTYETPDDHWHYVVDHAGALAMLVRTLPEAEQADVRRRIEEEVAPLVGGPGYALPGMCLNVLAA
jgi:hypothetical protein